ncbi:unnamed protein product [Prorocentrum cordatum]|uniref:Mediator of RNA polymerase II transcription subunit 9 n=1 Tax=Prorocentrum cordatum TaxID=2364126 RepID=A0ABN9U5X5_9DINO|nr:unnamed protein product [Polarella glacialis]
MSTALPKAGGKKAKEGQEALHAARVALRGLLSALQGGLGDLQADLAAACDADDAVLLPRSEEGATESSLAALKDTSELEGLRAKARETLLDSHRKHLRELREAVAARLALVKSKGGFKP